MNRLRRLSTFLDNHWLGDVIGVVAIFATGWLALVFAGVMQ